jgi:hypothetical protein
VVPRKLSGQYYYLDGEYPKHFGHFMTEIIPRLYAWDAAASVGASCFAVGEGLAFGVAVPVTTLLTVTDHSRYALHSRASSSVPT